MTRLDTHFDPAETGDFTPFSMSDMLMPEALLEETNWRENPLVVYSERRARRPMRFLLARLIELILIAGLVVMAAHIFFRVLLIKNTPVLSWHQWFMVKTMARGAANGSFMFPELLMPYLYGGFIFFLLRYHLFVNDQSSHMKNLSGERLGELLQTPLGRDEFFLHHLLMFCRSYRVIVGWAAVWAVFIATDVLTGGWIWVEPEVYAWMFLTLYLVMIVWVAGVFQYVVEWKWFAGGRARWWRIVVNLFFSVFLSLCIAASLIFWIDLFRIRKTFGFYEVAMKGPIAVSIVILGVAMVVTYPKAYYLYGAAEHTLRRRVDPE